MMAVNNMTNKEINNEYILKIDFPRNTENPSRIFLCLAELMIAFSDFDNVLLEQSGFIAKSHMILQNIESGSINTHLYNLIKSIDDKAIYNLKWQEIIGSFLLKTKYCILEYLAKNDKFSSFGDLQILTNRIDEIMPPASAIFIPTKTNPLTIIRGIKEFQSSLTKLSKTDRAFLLASDKKVEINKDFYLPDNIEKEFFTKEVVFNTSDMVLQVKKPDYLGESQWQFRVKDLPFFYAKITDKQWLDDFHKRKIDLRPGDSIEAKVIEEISLSHENVILEQKYEIKKVYSVIQNIAEKQMIINEFIRRNPND